MSTEKKGYYNSLSSSDHSPKKHHHRPIEGSDQHDHDGCEMKDSDAAWASTKISDLDSVVPNRAFFESNDSSKNYQFAVNASWVVNWFLLGEHREFCYYDV